MTATDIWAVAIVAALSTSCSTAPVETDARPASPLAVKTVVVHMTDVADAFEVGGVIHARTTAVVAARLVAPVLEVRVAPGDRVRAGQVLVVLDGRDLEAHARAAIAGSTAAADGIAAARADQQSAEASLTLARTTYDRMAALHAKRSATAHELDQATATLRAAESRAQAAAARAHEATAQLERAQATRDAAAATESFLRLTAPFDGLVTEKMIEPGNMTAPGLALLRVEDRRAFRVEVRVDESRASKIAPGTRVEVVLDGALDGEVAHPVVVGTVSEVSRAVDTDQRTSLVKVAVDAVPSLRSGAFARVRVPGGARRALTVPAEAVVTQGQVTSVFVVEDGVARVRLVRLREREVLAGLVEGDVVIVSPPPGLVDGRGVTTGGAP